MILFYSINLKFLSYPKNLASNLASQKFLLKKVGNTLQSISIRIDRINLQLDNNVSVIIFHMQKSNDTF